MEYLPKSIDLKLSMASVCCIDWVLELCHVICWNTVSNILAVALFAQGPSISANNVART
jgi:hypothetical protein